MSEPEDDDPLVRLALESGDGTEVAGPDPAPTGLEATRGSAGLIDTLDVAEVVAAVVDLLTP